MHAHIHCLPRIKRHDQTCWLSSDWYLVIVLNCGWWGHDGDKFAQLIYEDMTEINELDENMEKKKVSCTHYLKFMIAG